MKWMVCSRKLEWCAAAKGKLHVAGMRVGQVLDMDRVAKYQLGEGLIPENRVPLALKDV